MEFGEQRSLGMELMARKVGLCLVSGITVLLAACGGGSGNSGGGGGNQPTTPTVTVRPTKSSITVVDSLQVDVAVTGTSSVVTGTVVWTSGTYTSSPATLSGGSASVTIPAGSLVSGSNTIRVSYTPDSASSSVYNSTSGTATVTVNLLTPTVTVTPSAAAINTLQPLSVSVTVAGASGAPTPSGTVKLTDGSISQSATLSDGTATLSIAAAVLPPGNQTLTAAFAPDTPAGKTYGNASGTASVSVTRVTPTVTVTPAKNPIGNAESLSVTVTVVSPGVPVPTGSVVLTGGTYTSNAITLTGGAASFTIAAGALPVGKDDPLQAAYTPDTASQGIYGNASGTAKVTVNTLTTPTVTLNPASLTLTTSQSLSVTVNVVGTSGGTTPSGVIVLSGGSYTSPTPVALSAGSATIILPAYSLVFGSNTLSASYFPDPQSSSTYNLAVGSRTVTVARTTPTVTVTPAMLNIDSSQNLDVTVVVSGPGTGAPAATGTVNLKSGTTASWLKTLTNGSATITIPAGILPAGSDTLTATYTPDNTAAASYNSASGSSAAISVTLMTTVAVTQGTSIAAVTDQLLGMNLANWYDVVGNASSINAAFGKAGVKAIRWPGGSWSDVWHWHNNPSNAQLPYNCTNATGGTGWGGYSPFSDFVTSIAKGGNYDLALTANYGSNAACTGGGDPAEAAGWVAEAVSEGYPPSHVTVGNENFGSWEFDLHSKQWDPTTYAGSVVGAAGYYQSIKNASPNTLVGVVVDAGAVGGNGLANWDQVVLANAKYDFVEYHYYPQYGSVTNDQYLVFQAAQDFTTNIKTIKSELAAAGKATPVPIYVGELGGNSANPGTQSWSITQGLYTGQILGEAMNAGIARLTWWIGFGNCLGNAGVGSNPNTNNSNPSLYGWQNTWGALSIFSDIDPQCPGAGPIGTMSPTAQAFNLFQKVATTGASALATQVAGDTNDIRAYTAAQADGSNVLFVFNLSQTQNLPVTIKMSQQNASNDVTVITYDKKIYDYTNTACKTAPGCTYDPTHDYTNAQWAAPATKDMGAQTLPLKLTLTPWSMNVVTIK